MRVAMIFGLTALSMSACVSRGFSGAEVEVANPNPSVKNSPTDLVTRSTVYLEATGSCTAVIVSPSRVLTAKHCVEGVSAGQVRIIWGVDLQAGVAQVLGTQIRRHPKSDLATVDFSGQLPAGFKAAPIFDPGNSSFAPGQQAVVAGYGVVGEDSAGNTKGEVRYLRWGYVAFETWNAEVGDGRGRVYRSVLSWLPSQGSSMVCAGDSGGPLYAQFNGVWGLAGINSMSEVGCKTRGFTSDPRPNKAWILGN